MLMNGIPPLVVQAIGRWVSDSFMVYWRHITVILASQSMAKTIVDAPLLEDLYFVSLGPDLGVRTPPLISPLYQARDEAALQGELGFGFQWGAAVNVIIRGLSAQLKLGFTIPLPQHSGS